jgi:hypothetical protein
MLWLALLRAKPARAFDVPGEVAGGLQQTPEPAQKLFGPSQRVPLQSHRRIAQSSIARAGHNSQQRLDMGEIIGNIGKTQT